MSDVPSYDPNQTLGACRLAFRGGHEFADEDQPAIEWVKLGPLPVPIPNPPARHRALKLHDLHHVLTGYGTDWPGEFEISGWEVGAGLGGDAVAWTFCTGGTLAGLFRCPRRTVQAYVRGRQCRSLLGLDHRAVDRLTVAEGHALCGTDETDVPEPTAGDWLRVMGWGVVGLFCSFLPPVAYLASRFDRRPEPLPGTPIDDVIPAQAA